MVRDEEAYIEMAIESVLPYVKGLYILDTGSEDDTLSIIRSFNNSKIVVEERSFTPKEWYTYPDPKFNKWLEISCRNYAMERAIMIFNPKWLLQVDGDNIVNGNLFKEFQQINIPDTCGGLLLNQVPIADRTQ